MASKRMCKKANVHQSGDMCGLEDRVYEVVRHAAVG